MGKKFSQMDDEEIWEQFDLAVAKGCPPENSEDPEFIVKLHHENVAQSLKAMYEKPYGPSLGNIPLPSSGEWFMKMRRIRDLMCLRCVLLDECDGINCRRDG